MEDDYAGKLVNDGGRAASTVFYHSTFNVRALVPGNDSTFAATGSDFRRVRPKMFEWYDSKVRGILGGGFATFVRWENREET